MIHPGLRQILRIVKPKSYLIKNKVPSCGRDVCICLQVLDMNKYEDYEFYKECYDTWLNFNRGLNK